MCSDHTDIRPTTLVLLRLRDDYDHEGRALVEELCNWAIPDGVKDSGDEFTELARAFKRINAPVRDLGLTSLRVSTTALEGNTSTCNQLENDLASVTSMRDALANQLSGMLEDAEFHGQRISERGERILDSAADRLLDYVHRLAH